MVVVDVVAVFCKSHYIRISLRSLFFWFCFCHCSVCRPEQIKLNYMCFSAFCSTCFSVEHEKSIELPEMCVGLWC